MRIRCIWHANFLSGLAIIPFAVGLIGVPQEVGYRKETLFTVNYGASPDQLTCEKQEYSGLPDGVRCFVFQKDKSFVVGDAVQDRVKCFGSDGTLRWVSADRIDNISDVAVDDHDGSIYVSGGAGMDHLYRLDRNGRLAWEKYSKGFLPPADIPKFLLIGALHSAVNGVSMLLEGRSNALLTVDANGKLVSRTDYDGDPKEYTTLIPTPNGQVVSVGHAGRSTSPIRVRPLGRIGQESSYVVSPKLDPQATPLGNPEGMLLLRAVLDDSWNLYTVSDLPRAKETMLGNGVVLDEEIVVTKFGSNGQTLAQIRFPASPIKQTCWVDKKGNIFRLAFRDAGIEVIEYECVSSGQGAGATKVQVVDDDLN